MPEPTAREQVRHELAKREMQYAAWFAEDAEDTAERDAVRDLAREYGWEVPEREEDESEEDWQERADEDARDFVIAKRDEDNTMEESVLGFSMQVTVKVRVDLSTGGPGDWIDGDYDPSTGELDDVRYHFAPWFDHADVALGSDSPLYRLLERFTSAYDGMDMGELARIQ